MIYKNFSIYTNRQINQEKQCINYIRENMDYKNLKKTNFKTDPGIPDLQYEEDGEIKYIEIKCDNRTLSKKQMAWIERNKDKSVQVFNFDTGYKTVGIRVSKLSLSARENQALDVGKYFGDIAELCMKLREKKIDVKKVLGDAINGR